MLGNRASPEARSHLCLCWASFLMTFATGEFLILAPGTTGHSKHPLPTKQEKTLESPLDCKEIQPVQPKGDQSWIFIGRTDFEAETPILWPADVKSWLIWKDPDAGKDWRLEEKGMTAGGQREELRPWQRSWGRRLGIRKGVIKPQEIPCSRASTPKPESVLCSPP